MSAPSRDSFQNFQGAIGYGTGNVSDGGTYGVDYISHNRQRLDAMYRSSWICGKAVDVVAEDMTKRGIRIDSTMPPDQIDELMSGWSDLQIWDRIADTIKWARLYGGAIAVLLIDGQDLATPLRIESIRKDQFKGLLVLDRWRVNPSLSNLVKEFGPEMGQPCFYDVLSDPTSALNSQKIHYSRVIRIEGQDLPHWQKQTEQGWGQSVLERLFDRLLAFDSTTQGAAQLVYKAHLRTYKVKGLREIIAAGGPILAGLTKQISFMRATQTNEGLTLMDTEDEFETHTYTFAGLDAVLLQFSQQLSGALDIPLTRLFGQSPAGLNATGESDIRNYYDGINQQQERRLRSAVKLLLVITHLSTFGRALPNGSAFQFVPLWQLNDVEKATIAATTTTAITSAFTAQLIGQQTAMKELRQVSRITGLFSNISDESIAKASDEANVGGEFGAGLMGGDVEEEKKDETDA